MKDIYICHQYYDPSHFRALYDYANKYGYNIKKYIVLSQRHIIGTFLKKVVRLHIKDAVKWLLSNEWNLICARSIKNEILIVGLAPYDYLLNKYHSLFQNNKSIYFTSWQFWDGSNFPRGNISNRESFERFLRSSFKGAACVSKVTERSMSCFFSITETVNHSIPVNEYKNKDSYSRNHKYVYIGRLEPVKNIQLIIDTFKDINTASIDFIGYGALEEDVKSASAKYENIHYLGKWSKEQIKNNLFEYDFLVLPSLEEPFGIVLLESLAAGVPCIVSNALGPSEIVINGINGFISQTKIHIEFPAMIREAECLSKDEYEKLCKNALRMSTQYSTEEVVKKWLNLLKKI